MFNVALYSNIAYLIGGSVVFIAVIVLVMLAAHATSPRKKSGKDDRDEITCAGFSQMVNED